MRSDVQIRNVQTNGGKVGKVWVRVGVNGNEFFPSFRQLYDIIQGICYCEDMKYPSGKGRQMVREILLDCCELVADREAYWKELQQKYQIPEKGQP